MRVRSARSFYCAGFLRPTTLRLLVGFPKPFPNCPTGPLGAREKQSPYTKTARVTGFDVRPHASRQPGTFRRTRSAMYCGCSTRNVLPRSVMRYRRGATFATRPALVRNVIAQPTRFRTYVDCPLGIRFPALAGLTENDRLSSRLRHASLCPALPQSPKWGAASARK